MPRSIRESLESQLLSGLVLGPGTRCAHRAAPGGAFQAETTSSQRSNGARQKLALPCQRVAHDGLQVVEMRLPSEQRTGTVGSSHDLRWVPGPPAGERDL